MSQLTPFIYKVISIGQTMQVFISNTIQTKQIMLFVHETTLSMYNIFIFPVLFFSLFFLFLCIKTILTHSKKTSIIDKININEWPNVTIQIPTFNEIVALRCAKQCLEFDYPRNKFEVIIGDDSNDPAVSKKIDNFIEKHKNFIKVTRRGSNSGFKAGNLNHMLKYSKGDIIVIFDSDFIPNKYFLKSIVKPFMTNKNIGCVQSKWSFVNDSQNLITIFASSIILVYQKLIAPINNKLKVPLLFGSGQAIRKDLIKKLGGWQEGSLTEDVEFAVRILKNGYEIVYLDELKVRGEVPYTLKDLSKQQKKWAYGNVNAFLCHWKSIIFGNFTISQKIMLMFTLLGYASSIFLAIFIILGVVSFSTGEPAPINIGKFLIETVKSISVSSGFLISAILVLQREKKTHMISKVLLSAFTIGFIITLNVSIGIFNAISGKRMNWDLIQKRGNKN